MKKEETKTKERWKEDKKRKEDIFLNLARVGRSDVALPRVPEVSNVCICDLQMNYLMQNSGLNVHFESIMTQLTQCNKFNDPLCVLLDKQYMLVLSLFQKDPFG